VRLLVDGVGAYLGGHTKFRSLSAATSVRLKIKQNHLVTGWLLNDSGGVRLQGGWNMGFLENRDR